MPDYLRFFPDWVRDADPPKARTEIHSWRDLDVHLERVPAPDAPAKLLIFHGAGGHARMLLPYVRLGGPAEVVLPDLPGYGRTEARSSGYDTWLDLAEHLIRTERDGRPLYVLGASVGGMLAYNAVARAGAEGLIVTCLLDLRRPEVRAAAARYAPLGRAAGLLNAARLADDLRVPVRWLTRMSSMANDPALNVTVANDPQGGGNRVSLRFLRTLMVS
ncbi:alpha/beta hydrolase [Spirillospora sp. CA-294931]|uniref:alpha/beta hydrolase n=1 Tax=Spirillospora sp. CA-294931 TaxID=3240042 RepID=UPI003D90ED4B